MCEIDYQIEDYMEYCDSKNLSRKTIESYEKTLKLFVSEKFGIEDARLVDESMVRKYINYMKERGKYTITTNSATLEVNRLFNRTRDYIVLSVSLFLDKKFQNVLQKSWIYATILWYNVDEIKDGIANENWLRKSFNRRTIFE